MAKRKQGRGGGEATREEKDVVEGKGEEGARRKQMSNGIEKREDKSSHKRGKAWSKARTRGRRCMTRKQMTKIREMKKGGCDGRAERRG